MSHSLLLRSLELHLRDTARIQFREPNLNGWAMGGDFGSPDLLEIPCSYSRFVRKIFEVKFSQADLLADLRADKWTKYLPICDRMIFAVGEGVDYEKHLRPLPVGIMAHKNGKWRTIRAAPANPLAKPWPQNVWMALLFGKMGANTSTRLLRLEREAERLKVKEIQDLRLHAWKKMSDMAREIQRNKAELETREKKLKERELDTARIIREEVLQDIAKKAGISHWSISSSDKILSRWAEKTLKASFEDLQVRLNSESEKGGDQ